MAAMLKRRIEGHIVPCTYSVRGQLVQLEWKLKVDGETPQASHLFYDPVADTFTIEGEPDRTLTRKKPSRQ